MKFRIQIPVFKRRYKNSPDKPNSSSKGIEDDIQEIGNKCRRRWEIWILEVVKSTEGDNNVVVPSV